ncbi:MAG TPA: Ig-like domain-containing protein, partial [Roseiflexaceae bacterium]|nr:Ig-like domain-containing protein [Roseiflexaceae bacterium]
SLDNASMQSPTGLGTPFIKFSTDTHINNSTSTKQPVNSTSGLLVLAGDDSTRYYLHNKLTLGPADTTPPDTTIDSGPSGTVTSTSADFTFSANEAGSTFACSLDGAAFSACSSPTSYSGLADGGHTFQVRATDPVGNTDPTPASRTWTVATGTPDTTPPSVTLTAPSDGATVSGSVTLSADASDNVAVARVDFIVGGEVTGSDTTAPYSISWNSASVVDGSATIIAQAVDTANLATTSAGRTVTVDNTTPDTTIDSGPTGTVTSTSADFTFSANEAGSTFACSLDGAAFSACSSPTSYSGLVDGGHTFQVRATDAAGNTDASPASQTWTVSTGSSGTTLFSDGFESGDFSPWSLVKTGGDGSATVQNSIVKTGSFAAHLSATTSTGSYAYIRQALDTAQTDVTVTGDFQLLAEGVSGANVPFFRLFDSSGTRLISLYRQNLSGNKLYIQINGTNYSTTGFLPLNTWAQLSVHVVTAGTGASTVQVYLDGTQIYGTSTASLGSTGVLNMQVGNDTAKQAFTYIADNISVTR